MTTDAEFELIEKRFEALNEHFRLIYLGIGSFNKDEILKHLKARDEIGEIIVNRQLYYLKKLKER